MYLTDDLINLPKERIYFLYLLDLVHAAENKLWENSPPVPVSRKGRLCGSFLLYRRLCTLADKTLEALWKDRMAEKNPLTRFDARLASTKEQTEAAAELLTELEETDGRPLFTAAPLLSSRLDACADRFCAVFAEMLERIAQNRREICDAFFSGEDFGSITGWSAQMADLHFHGRSTLRVDTEKGSFYYKPRDCRTDVLFGQIVNRWTGCADRRGSTGGTNRTGGTNCAGGAVGGRGRRPDGGRGRTGCAAVFGTDQRCSTRFFQSRVPFGDGVSRGTGKRVRGSSSEPDPYGPLSEGWEDDADRAGGAFLDGEAAGGNGHAERCDLRSGGASSGAVPV